MSFFIVAYLPPSRVVEFSNSAQGTARQIGLALFTEYLLPFEVTSVLILIAIVGAVVLARKEID
jgi:NADH-quinone oxidoreductase subunit J